ncbi:MAG TPA: hypothetical protein VK666_29735, partial [Chryseolinea sp.]|nr:hypothetical protein [Chryseolinea sp.]
MTLNSMSRIAIIKVLFLVIITPSLYGQKVKYKDIYGLLSTKQYEAAEPFLRKYLKETTDNPNAYLFMGIVFQEKAMKEDVLKSTPKVIGAIDSAVIFYDKAYKTITEKEIKKNNEYYAAYNRRDLRTGEFGVKLSDIQFDLEKRMEGLRERIDRIKMVKYYFSLADTMYGKSNALYKKLQAQYPGEKQLYLRADDATLKELSTLNLRFDSCQKAFDQYKSSMSMLGKSSYNQSLTLHEIADFKKDGAIKASFLENEVQLWDYSRFAMKAKRAIETDIIPMRDHLVSYDVEINKLREKLSKDSVSVKSDLTSLIDKLLMEQLKKYDSVPLPMEIFTLKIADLEYRSTLIEHRHRDSSDMHASLSMVGAELRYLSKLDSIATKLTTDNLDEKIIDYDFFVKNTYATPLVLKAFTSALKDFSTREMKIKQAQFTRRSESLRWLVNGADSIPLFYDNVRSKYKPLLVLDEKYTAGLHYTDSLHPSG